MFSACAAQAKLLEAHEAPSPSQASAKASAKAGGPGPQAIPKNVKSSNLNPNRHLVQRKRALPRFVYQDCSCLPNLSRRYLNVHECASNDFQNSPNRLGPVAHCRLA